MKKITMVVVGVLVSSFTFAGWHEVGPPNASGMAVVKFNSTSYNLIYKSQEESNVKVRIFNGENVLVFSETIRKSDGFVRPYNFGRLAEGVYTIQIDNGTAHLAETVEYHQAETQRIAQLIKMKDGKFMLRVPGNGEDRLRVRIIDEQGKALRTDYEPVYGDFAKVYDLSKVPGAVSFDITDKDGVARNVQN